MYVLEEEEIDRARNIQNEIYRNNNSSLSEILHYCPNLRDFSIAYTGLFDFGEGLQLEQNKRVYGKVTFGDNVCSSLSSFSRYTSYISDMRMRHGSFVERGRSSNILRGAGVDYIDILMLDTKFDGITYYRNFTRISAIYLKFLKTGDDQPVYYYGEEGRFKKCSLLLESPSEIDESHTMYFYRMRSCT
ncbi:hypothetical protein HPULCUR_004378 [Helicostylum pulchrum]|uniref:Uncharacterized protein n=1 Tax=Helicostylum pulchrum TaxID=562976 RepID=A0ABP9XW25_9FUNG